MANGSITSVSQTYIQFGHGCRLTPVEPVLVDPLEFVEAMLCGGG